MLKNTQNGWAKVKNFFSIGSKTKTTKTNTTFKVSSPNSEILKNEISKTVSAASEDMLEQAFLESKAFFQECSDELKKCDFIGDSDSEEQQ